MDADLTTCAKARKTREGALPVWRPMHEARQEERDFLDGDRYVNWNDLSNKDRRRQQFRGQELSDTNRHIAAVATAAPRNVEARPNDQLSDPRNAELAVAVLSRELDDPLKGFDEVAEEVIQDAVDCRAGCAMLDFDPDMGPWGELYVRWKDANLIMFEPGFTNPHHPRCGWLQEVRRMHVDEIKAMGKLKGKKRWRVPKELYADGQAFSSFTGEKNPDGSPQLAGNTSGGNLLGVPLPPVDDEHQWVLFCWYKNDPSTYKRQKAGTTREMPEGARYMACDNPECEHRSDTQEQLLEDGRLGEGERLPDEMEPCPDCGGHLSRRDLYAEEETVAYYPKGRLLVIQPLLQSLPDDEPYYEGEWPCPEARSFPILWVTRYLKPGRAMGDSDTTRNWDQQIASDQMLTMVNDRVMRHQNYYVMDEVGFYNTKGGRFEFRDDDYNVILKRRTNTMTHDPQISVMAGSSLDPEWVSVWQSIQTVLRGNQPKADLGLTPQSSKDIAASTVAQLTQQAELPVEHFIRRKNRAFGQFYGVYWDYIRYTYTKGRLARLRLAGEDIVERLYGDELPNYDFIVSESPPFSGIEKARTDAFDQLLEVATNRPEWLDEFAEIHKFPPSIVRRVQSKLRQMQEKAEQAPPPGGGTPEPTPTAQPPSPLTAGYEPAYR